MSADIELAAMLGLTPEALAEFLSRSPDAPTPERFLATLGGPEAELAHLLGLSPEQTQEFLARGGEAAPSAAAFVSSLENPPVAGTDVAPETAKFLAPAMQRSPEDTARVLQDALDFGPPDDPMALVADLPLVGETAQAEALAPFEQSTAAPGSIDDLSPEVQAMLQNSPAQDDLTDAQRAAVQDSIRAREDAFRAGQPKPTDEERFGKPGNTFRQLVGKLFEGDGASAKQLNDIAQKDVNDMSPEEGQALGAALADAGVDDDTIAAVVEPAPEGTSGKSGLSVGTMLMVLLGGGLLGGVLSQFSDRDRRGRRRVDPAQGFLGGAAAGAKALGTFATLEQARLERQRQLADADQKRQAELDQSNLKLLTDPKSGITADDNPEVAARAARAAGVSQLNVSRAARDEAKVADQVRDELLNAQKFREQGFIDEAVKAATRAGELQSQAEGAINYERMPSIDVWTFLRANSSRLSVSEKRRAFLQILDRGDFNRPAEAGGFEFTKKQVRDEAKNLGVKLDKDMKGAIDLAFEEVPGPLGGQ